MRDARTPVPKTPGEPPPAPPPPAPAGFAVEATGAGCRRRRDARGAAALLLAILAATGASPPAADAAEASVGVLLRSARYALARGDADRAREELRSACEAEPDSPRGLEAALLLASLEFRDGDRAAAERALAAPAGMARAVPGAADALGLARGWLALGVDDPASARRAFAAVATSADPAARDLSSIGSAWAALAAGDTASAIATLAPVATRSVDPALVLAARWSLARARRAAGDRRREQQALRSLRRLVRTTSFADDVELALAVSAIEDGKPRSARQSLRRLDRLSGLSSGPPGAPGDRPSFDDLLLPPRGFVGRIASLYARRPAPAEPTLEFLRRVLDRDARADAPRALRMVAAMEGVAR